MLAFLQRFLAGPPTSSQNAKQRLKLLLIHDQVDLSQAQLDMMRDEILDVINRYMDIDQSGVEFRLNRSEGQVALISSVPVRRVTARAS
ncbi:MAG: cell division topological specificity factor MinE [Deltaproteobacteria bacterium]|nr:cell division topological specificity factor MinE [Deltaproteobacteria bacterium]